MGSITDPQAGQPNMVPSSQRCEPGSVNIPVADWPPTAQDKSVDADAVATQLINSFNKAITNKDYGALADLFHESSYWRDHLALSWDLHTLKGRKEIVAQLEKGCPLTEVRIDRASAWRSPTLCGFNSTGDVKGIQLYTTIRTESGTGRGIVRLAEKEGMWKIWIFYTALMEIAGHEETIHSRRGKGVQHGANPGRKNWSDRRLDETNFEGHEPDVLIIGKTILVTQPQYGTGNILTSTAGAGQGGLTAHARLKMLNVPTLIIDKNDAVGDNWRKRYHQLVLHDPVWYDQLPYLSFPDNWPIFTPKDKLADWFEVYVKALELNVWMKSYLESASWDETTKQWTVNIKRTLPDGNTESRVLHPKHIVQATGHAGKEYFPDIKGRDSFRGDLVHSSNFPGARTEGKGKRAVVIGACNSSHDICQDYYEKGYDVTMVQRSTTCVVSSDSATSILLGGLYEEGGPPIEDSDLWVWGLPSEVLKALHHGLTKKQIVNDAELLAGLERAGFKLDLGPDDCGLFFKYFQRGGGYYFEVGASQLIIDGKIKVKQGQEVTEILPHGVKFADGTEVQADEIVFATGFDNMRTQARAIFGDDVADRVEDVWGFDSEGEIRTLWRRSGQPGLWFHGGNLAICRYFSRVLALQIKAQLEGLVE